MPFEMLQDSMVNSIRLVLQAPLFRGRPVVTSHPLLHAHRDELERYLQDFWADGAVQKWMLSQGTERLLIYLIRTGMDTGLLMGMDLSAIGQLTRRYHETFSQTCRDVLYAATEGRLLVVHPSETEEFVDNPDWDKQLPVVTASDIGTCRNLVTTAMREGGVPSRKVLEYTLSVSEAVTNIVKHAGNGYFRLMRTGDQWTAYVADSGPGIDLAVLPHSTLLRGYSTKPSLGLGFTAMLRCLDRLVLATSPAGTTLLLQLFGSQGHPGGVKA